MREQARWREGEREAEARHAWLMRLGLGEKEARRWWTGRETGMSRLFGFVLDSSP